MKRIRETRFGPRKLVACDNCYRKKIKCRRNNDEEKCAQCTRLKIRCVNRKTSSVFIVREDSLDYYSNQIDKARGISSDNESDSGGKNAGQLGGPGNAPSSSIQFYDMVWDSISMLPQDYVGSFKPNERPNFSSLNVNEHFLDYSFLKKSQISVYVGKNCLPDKQVADYLLQIASSNLCLDYQVMLRKSTPEFVDRLYANPNLFDTAEGTEKLEIVRIFLMLAFGRLYSRIEPVEEEYPGITYFKIALAIIQEDYDTVTVSFIEVHVLLSLYLTTLNKLKHAYIYSGTALRSAYLLNLHVPATYNDSKYTAVERERMKRLWWTVYNLDIFVSSILGFPMAIHENMVGEVGYPVEGNYNGELSSPSFLVERIILTKIKSKIMKTIYSNNQTQLLRSINELLLSLESRSQSILLLSSKDHDTADQGMISRSSSSLFLRLNENIIMATAPFLLLFRKLFIIDSLKKSATSPDNSSSKFLKVTISCVNAALANIEILCDLFITEGLSLYGYIDVNFLFYSSIIILLCERSKLTQITELCPRGVFKRCLSLLSEFTKVGNVVANDYLNRIMALKVELDAFEGLLVKKTTDNNEPEIYFALSELDQTLADTTCFKDHDDGFFLDYFNFIQSNIHD